MNGVQEAASSNLVTRTKKVPQNVCFAVLFFCFFMKLYGYESD
nr:MAG TPA: hypothetical protein [Caudoviricetes sp.]